MATALVWSDSYMHGLQELCHCLPHGSNAIVAFFQFTHIDMCWQQENTRKLKEHIQLFWKHKWCLTFRDKTKIILYSVYIIRKHEMLLCHKWQLQGMGRKVHSACPEEFEGEWNKFIILFWFQYFKPALLFSDEMQVKQCKNIWYSKRFGKTIS